MAITDLPQTLDGYAIELQAKSEADNIARAYAIRAHIDLFGWFIVERHWARIGKTGRSQRQAFRTEHEAKRFIRVLLLRRASACRRIGTVYEQIAA